MNFIETMRQLKEAEVEVNSGKAPLAVLKRGLKKAKHGFLKAMKKKGGVALIAEFKRCSPSSGNINSGADLGHFVGMYDRHADAISILTEQEFFSGSLADLKIARGLTKKPILRKDFIVDAYQIYESRKAGADAILLIAGLLDAKKINEFIAVADRLGMDSLVECFDEEGLKTVIASKARIIGVNNRNLVTMDEDFSRTRRFVFRIPKARRAKCIIVSESSVHSGLQVASLAGTADAALVGSSIMSAPSPKAKLKELSGKTLVKICGMTNAKDAVGAVKLGADVIGLNFYEKSPRFVDVETAKGIADAVRGMAVVCGVFVNELAERVGMIAREVGLDMLQFSGDESPQYVNSFKAPVIKAIRVKDMRSLDGVADFETPKIMLDSFAAGLYGGTGKKFDADLVDVGKLRGRQLVLSGGLGSGNVKGIIRRFRPFMVDVCSGVEEKPGGKSLARMKEFISAVGSVNRT